MTAGGSITVGNDLFNGAEIGLLITGNHVAVNLNGHTIDGTGSAQGLSVIGTGTTVENGVVQQFSTGVSPTAVGSRAQGLTPTTTVSGNKALNTSGDGILGGGAAGIVATGNTANGNATDGIATGGQTTLSKNTAFFNTALGTAASPFDTDAGGDQADGNGTCS